MLSATLQFEAFVASMQFYESIRIFDRLGDILAREH